MGTDIPEPGDESILVLAPLGRDAELAASALNSAGFHTEIFRTLREIVARLQENCGAVIMAEEALDPATLPSFAAALRNQPAWSDIPIILLDGSAGSVERTTAPKAPPLPGTEANVTLLERPCHVATLRSAAGVALRARRRQYQVRDLLRERDEVLGSERAARSQAERAGRMKDEFLATLSHELRTPLNAIVGWCTLLQEGPENAEELAHGLETIERNARAQTRIIEDLLDMSRIISGKIRLEVHPLNVVKIVQAALDTVRPAAEARRIALDVHLDGQSQPILGDANRLQQVFWNFLSNAIKFTPEGGAITVTSRRLDGHVEVTVKDSGQGIPPDFLPYVFDRFRQMDSSSTRRHGGLGLGLAIVKQLVELHGGHVRAESAGLGAGATFAAQFPNAAKAAASSATDAPRESSPVLSVAERAEPSDKHALDGLKVLVVDDEPDARELVKRLLEGSGAAVRAAGTAEEALTLLGQSGYDVLVSDIGMPGQDGYALIRKVRSLAADRGGNIPAIALTAYAREEDRTRALGQGFQMHTSKPVEPAELLRLVGRLANRK